MGKSKIIRLIIFLCVNTVNIIYGSSAKTNYCVVRSNHSDKRRTDRGMCPKGEGAREDTRVNEAYGGQIILTITLLSFTRCKSTRGRRHTLLGPPSFAIPVACKLRLEGSMIRL